MRRECDEIRRWGEQLFEEGDVYRDVTAELKYSVKPPHEWGFWDRVNTYFKKVLPYAIKNYVTSLGRIPYPVWEDYAWMYVTSDALTEEFKLPQLRGPFARILLNVKRSDENLYKWLVTEVLADTPSLTAYMRGRVGDIMRLFYEELTAHVGMETKEDVSQALEKREEATKRFEERILERFGRDPGELIVRASYSEELLNYFAMAFISEMREAIVELYKGIFGEKEEAMRVMMGRIGELHQKYVDLLQNTLKGEMNYWVENVKRTFTYPVETTYKLETLLQPQLGEGEETQAQPTVPQGRESRVGRFWKWFVQEGFKVEQPRMTVAS